MDLDRGGGNKNKQKARGLANVAHVHGITSKYFKDSPAGSVEKC